ncbi:oxidoreductase [Fictibacillus arsenicus]|uniref:Oxidoreductase n=1 Tax=Fictibacillus arsenicus TaxID=255247 RepID=A0A1B1Z2P4_9BACL|nr:SDR family oxidoreductase [Fictibacillus arsenicus]ANX11661.1 oxidoreductase [Fictibacillus arsenicus]
MGKLNGKVALVTGASSGFGRGISLALAEEGAKVIVADLKRNTNEGGFEDNNISTDQVIIEMGGQAIFAECDVTKATEVKYAVQTAVEEFGRLDIIVNNAGIYRGGDYMHNLTEEDLDMCLNVNVKGSWNGCQHAITQFLKQGDGGKIINIVSTAGLGGYPSQAPYNMSKGAAANLTRTIAIEYGPHKITANGICPTYCKTSLTRPFFENEELRNNVESKIPLGRWGEVDDVAKLAVFLASEDSNYINGVMVPLDGGETLSSFSNQDFGLRVSSFHK